MTEMLRSQSMMYRSDEFDSKPKPPNQCIKQSQKSKKNISQAKLKRGALVNSRVKSVKKKSTKTRVKLRKNLNKQKRANSNVPTKKSSNLNITEINNVVSHRSPLALKVGTPNCKAEFKRTPKNFTKKKIKPKQSTISKIKNLSRVKSSFCSINKNNYFFKTTKPKQYKKSRKRDKKTKTKISMHHKQYTSNQKLRKDDIYVYKSLIDLKKHSQASHQRKISFSKELLDNSLENEIESGKINKKVQKLSNLSPKYSSKIENVNFNNDWFAPSQLDQVNNLVKDPKNKYDNQLKQVKTLKNYQEPSNYPATKLNISGELYVTPYSNTKATPTRRPNSRGTNYYDQQDSIRQAKQRYYSTQNILDAQSEVRQVPENMKNPKYSNRHDSVEMDSAGRSRSNCKATELGSIIGQHSKSVPKSSQKASSKSWSNNWVPEAAPKLPQAPDQLLQMTESVFGELKESDWKAAISKYNSSTKHDEPLEVSILTDKFGHDTPVMSPNQTQPASLMSNPFDPMHSGFDQPAQNRPLNLFKKAPSVEVIMDKMLHKNQQFTNNVLEKVLSQSNQSVLMLRECFKDLIAQKRQSQPRSELSQKPNLFSDSEGFGEARNNEHFQLWNRIRQLEETNSRQNQTILQVREQLREQERLTAQNEHEIRETSAKQLKVIGKQLEHALRQSQTMQSQKDAHIRRLKSKLDQIRDERRKCRLCMELVYNQEYLFDKRIDRGENQRNLNRVEQEDLAFMKMNQKDKYVDYLDAGPGIEFDETEKTEQERMQRQAYPNETRSSLCAETRPQSQSNSGISHSTNQYTTGSEKTQETHKKLWHVFDDQSVQYQTNLSRIHSQSPVEMTSETHNFTRTHKLVPAGLNQDAGQGSLEFFNGDYRIEKETPNEPSQNYQNQRVVPVLSKSNQEPKSLNWLGIQHCFSIKRGKRSHAFKLHEMPTSEKSIQPITSSQLDNFASFQNSNKAPSENDVSSRRSQPRSSQKKAAKSNYIDYGKNVFLNSGSLAEAMQLDQDLLGDKGALLEELTSEKRVRSQIQAESAEFQNLSEDLLKFLHCQALCMDTWTIAFQNEPVKPKLESVRNEPSDYLGSYMHVVEEESQENETEYSTERELLQVQLDSEMPEAKSPSPKRQTWAQPTIESSKRELQFEKSNCGQESNSDHMANLSSQWKTFRQEHDHPQGAECDRKMSDKVLKFISNFDEVSVSSFDSEGELSNTSSKPCSESRSNPELTGKPEFAKAFDSHPESTAQIEPIRDDLRSEDCIHQEPSPRRQQLDQEQVQKQQVKKAEKLDDSNVSLSNRESNSSQGTIKQKENSNMQTGNPTINLISVNSQKVGCEFISERESKLSNENDLAKFKKSTNKTANQNGRKKRVNNAQKEVELKLQKGNFENDENQKNIVNKKQNSVNQKKSKSICKDSFEHDWDLFGCSFGQQSSSQEPELGSQMTHSDNASENYLENNNSLETLKKS